MRIAIFGGLGFAGFSLGKYLKRHYPDYQVDLYDNMVRRGTELNSLLVKDHNLKFTHCDIRCKEDLDGIESDIIIDASADASVLAGLETGTRKVIETNFGGSINLIELALHKKAKFIFISTSRVYSIEQIKQLKLVVSNAAFRLSTQNAVVGVSENGIREEFSTSGAKSIYGATKYCIEQILEEYIHFLNLEAIINRCGVLAGPGQFGKIDQGILMFWLLRHFQKKSLSYIGYEGKGYQVRDFLHVLDFCKVIDLQIHDFEKYKNQIFNIGGGSSNSASLCQLTEMAQKFTGNTVPIEGNPESRQADIPWYVTDHGRFSNMSGWRPENSLEKIFADSHLWLQENEFLLRKIIY